MDASHRGGRSDWRSGSFLSLATAIVLALGGQVLVSHGLETVDGFTGVAFFPESLRTFLLSHGETLGFGLYLLAAGLFVHFFARHGGWVTEEEVSSGTGGDLAVLGCIVLLAAALRLYLWATVPPGVHVDEAINGLNGLGVLLRNHYPVFFENSDGREILMPYLIAGSFRLFGICLFAFKAVPLVIGLMTIGVVYLLGRELFGSKVGLLAAFLMAVSKWHLMISRVTHEAVPVPLLTAVAVLFLVRALRRERTWDFLACGATLGLGMYTYPAFRAVPILVVLSVVVHTLQKRGHRAGSLRGLAATTGAALVISLPFALYMLGHWTMFSQRMRVTSFYMDPNYNGNVLSTLWDNTLKSLSLFYTKSAAVYYLPGDRVLDGVSIVLFTLGLACCLWFWRNGRLAVLPLWLAAGLLPSVLSHAVRLPHALRTSPLIPLAPLLVAVTLWCLVRALVRPMAPSLLAAVTIAVPLALIAGLNLVAYFRAYARDPAIASAFDPVPNAVARATNELSLRYDVFVIPLVAEHSSFRLLTFDHSRYRVLDGSNVVGVKGTLQRDIVCILSPFDVERYESCLARLHHDYPQGVLTEHRNSQGELLFVTFIVRKEDVVDAPGTGRGTDWGSEDVTVPILHTVSGSDHGLVGWYYHDDLESAMWLGAPKMVRLDERIEPGKWSNADFTFSIIWRGQLAAAIDGDYLFGTESSDGSWVCVDGHLVVDNGGRHRIRDVQSKIRLLRGRHEIEVWYVFEEDRPQMALYWVPPGGRKEVVPAEVLFPLMNPGEPPFGTVLTGGRPLSRPLPAPEAAVSR